MTTEWQDPEKEGIADKHLYKSLHFKDFDGKGLGFSGKVAQGSRGFFDMGRRSQISEGTINVANKSQVVDVIQGGDDTKRASNLGS